MEKPQEKRQNGGATKFCGAPGNRIAAPLPKLAAPPPFSGSTCLRQSTSWAFGWADAPNKQVAQTAVRSNTKLHVYFDFCYAFRNSEAKVRLMWHMENPTWSTNEGQFPREHGLSRSLATTWLIKPRQAPHLVEGNVTHAHVFPPLLRRLETHRDDPIRKRSQNFLGASFFEKFGPLTALWGKF